MTDFASDEVEHPEKYSQYAAVYQRAVSDVHNRGESVRDALSNASENYSVDLTKEAIADLEWVIEEEVEKFEEDSGHSLSFLHEYFDGKTVQSLEPRRGSVTDRVESTTEQSGDERDE